MISLTAFAKDLNAEGELKEGHTLSNQTDKLFPG